MQRVRQKDTAAELQVRKLLTSLNARYRLNVRTLPGSPDLASCTRRKAIFVHGCFWHHHAGCARGRLPKANKAFWSEKLDANSRRDAVKIRNLRTLGFDVLVVWECQLENPDRLRRRLKRFWFSTTD